MVNNFEWIWRRNLRVQAVAEKVKLQNKYWEGKLINSQYIIDKLIISTCKINRA